MNQRLQSFLSAENLSQAQFADMIGVARASVSHIVAGRNKPGFDFIESVALHFPNLNLEWLISGKGRMYKADAYASEAGSEIIKTDTESESAAKEKSATPAASPVAPTPQSTVKPCEKSDNQDINIDTLTSGTGRNIARIVIFYDDNTYRELK